MNQLKPFFTIVIPTLNEEKYLPQLLEDLTNQTLTNFEVIVVDGKSEDKTRETAHGFTDLTLQVITSQKRNVSHQRNLGGKAAQAEWLIFMDADNRIPTYFLEGIKYQLSKHNPDSFTTHIQPDTSHQSDKAIARVSNLGISLSSLIKQPTAFGALIGAKKSAFSKIGGFNEKTHHQEDTEFVRNMVKNNFSFKVFPEPTITYSFRRFRKEGTLKLIRKFAKLNLAAFANLPNLAEKDYPMMGGTYYQDIASKQAVFDFNRINQNIKKLTKTQRQKLQNLLTRLENDLPL